MDTDTQVSMSHHHPPLIFVLCAVSVVCGPWEKVYEKRIVGFKFFLVLEKAVEHVLFNLLGSEIFADTPEDSFLLACWIGGSFLDKEVCRHGV